MKTNETAVMKIYNEVGGYDVCEVEVGGTRVIRVLDSSHSNVTPWEPDRAYSMQYDYACGYQD